MKSNLRAIPETDQAFDQACKTEEPINSIRNMANALAMIAETMEAKDGLVVQELAWIIADHVSELEKIHEFFWRQHHPERERYERSGWPSDRPQEEAR